MLHTYRFLLVACVSVLAGLIVVCEATTIQDEGMSTHAHWIALESDDYLDNERWLGQAFQDEDAPSFLFGAMGTTWIAACLPQGTELAENIECDLDFGLLYLENRCLRL
ncbi:MAG: hypothetical protein ACKO66_07890 [Flavobacteriales bacterium]